MVRSDYTIHHCQPAPCGERYREWLPASARLVLNSIVQGRGSTACTRLGSNRSMVSVKVRLGFVHVHVFWGSVSVNRSSALSMICLSSSSIKSSSSLSSSLSGVIVYKCHLLHSFIHNLVLDHVILLHLHHMSVKVPPHVRCI